MMPLHVFSLVFSIAVLGSEVLRWGLNPDWTGKLEIFYIQKVPVAVRQLCYKLSSDALDEYVRVGMSTGIDSLKEFCGAIDDFYRNSYINTIATEYVNGIE